MAPVDPPEGAVVDGVFEDAAAAGAPAVLVGGAAVDAGLLNKPPKAEAPDGVPDCDAPPKRPEGVEEVAPG